MRRREIQRKYQQKISDVSQVELALLKLRQPDLFKQYEKRFQNDGVERNLEELMNLSHELVNQVSELEKQLSEKPIKNRQFYRSAIRLQSMIVHDQERWFYSYENGRVRLKDGTLEEKDAFRTENIQRKIKWLKKHRDKLEEMVGRKLYPSSVESTFKKFSESIAETFG